MSEFREKTAPTCHFKNESEFKMAAEKWKHILQLDNWCIYAELARLPELMPDTFGTCDVNHAARTAHIVIKASPISMFPRWCEELTLVHELMHCIVIVPEEDSETIEGALYTMQQERLVETMAKSLLMARYNVDMNWFQENYI